TQFPSYQCVCAAIRRLQCVKEMRPTPVFPDNGVKQQSILRAFEKLPQRVAAHFPFALPEGPVWNTQFHRLKKFCSDNSASHSDHVFRRRWIIDPGLKLKQT